MRRAAGVLLGCVLLGAGIEVAGRAEPFRDATASGAALGSRALPAGDLPITRVRHYRMAGRVRPLLFWFGKDDVGMARVVWREDGAGQKGYELLVGTDPARAPRALNRWGFIAERTDASGGALLALMTRADEASYDEAAAATGSGANEFRAIRGRVADGLARFEVSRVRVPSPLTVHDLDAAVTLVSHDGGRVQVVPVAPGTRPGFLVSVAALLDGVVEGPSPVAPPPVRYVFGQRLHELRVGQVRRLTSSFQGRRVAAVRVPFEIRTLSTGDRTPFEITAGTEGDLKGVPLLIQWQPRWWLKVELHLTS